MPVRLLSADMRVGPRPDGSVVSSTWRVAWARDTRKWRAVSEAGPSTSAFRRLPDLKARNFAMAPLSTARRRKFMTSSSLPNTSVNEYAILCRRFVRDIDLNPYAYNRFCRSETENGFGLGGRQSRASSSPAVGGS